MKYKLHIITYKLHIITYKKMIITSTIILTNQTDKRKLNSLLILKKNCLNVQEIIIITQGLLVNVENLLEKKIIYIFLN